MQGGKRSSLSDTEKEEEGKEEEEDKEETKTAKKKKSKMDPTVDDTAAEGQQCQNRAGLHTHHSKTSFSPSE